MYFGFYTCITEHIHVFQILYMSYRVSTCLTKLILVLRNLYWSYRTYYCLTDLILVRRYIIIESLFSSILCLRRNLCRSLSGSGSHKC